MRFMVSLLISMFTPDVSNVSCLRRFVRARVGLGTAGSELRRLCECVCLVGLLTPISAAAGCPLGEGEQVEVLVTETPWDVNQPGYQVESTSANIDVTEGTWLSVDISPDGKQLVFDLLGDLYLLPIEGGEATPITEGLAWDIQPRFSPNGKELAFVSDRGGADNVWILTLSSGALRQVTDESFRLLNNPVWHPNGRYIAAKKHFTTSRSLGTGEIWLFETNASMPSKGIQLIERPNKNYQKELGEPAFTPSGDELYFTQSATPGNTFIYHDDSHGELFQIRRRDLKTGETDKVAGGFGGAVRPVPSRDGKQIAYVSRVRAESRLFVMDLQSQQARMLVDDLDPDMQETWGVYGLYPNMAWTPDDQSIVYWSKGGLFTVDVATGESMRIPFRVRGSRTLFPPPEVRVAVADDQLTTRMIRFARAQPGQQRWIFESLGKLHQKRGNQLPQPLFKKPAAHHEFSPVMNAGGDELFFLTWSDQTLGAIWRATARGQRLRQLDLPPGHYVELEISPDDRYLTYRKLSGSALTHPNWGKNSGLYLYDLETGIETQLHDKGYEPHFGPDNRVYFSHRNWSASGRGSDSSASTELQSVTLAGYDLRTHASGELVRAFRIAPTGGQVAFIENYQLFVAPLPALGMPLTLGADFTGLSLRQVSTHGAAYPYWSKDGQRLHWSMGSMHYDQVISPEPATTVDPKLVDLSLVVDSDRPKGLVALIGGRIITMQDDQKVIEQGTILVRDNRIIGVGAVAEVEVPSDARRVDMRGKTLMPGMVDAHAHGPYARNDVIPQSNYSLLAHLALGVTTVHNPSSKASEVFAAAEYQRAGRILGPRIFSTGEVVYGAKSLGFARINNFEQAQAHVRRLKAQGAVSIKNYNQPRRAQRQQVIEAARQEGLAVVAEGASLFQLDMNLIADGSTGIEHNIPTLKIYDDVRQFWGQSSVGYTPTLVVTYGGLTSEDYYYQKTEVWKHPILSRFVPPDALQARSVRRVMAPESDFRDDDAAAVALQLAEQGVIVNTGAHGQREGLATHWELWSFVRGGFTPLEALKLATINPARYLGMDQDIGSLEPGKLADIVVLNRNPLIDIHHTQEIADVMINGRLFDAKTLAERVTGDRQAPRLWWHDRDYLQIR